MTDIVKLSFICQEKCRLNRVSEIGRKVLTGMRQAGSFLTLLFFLIFLVSCDQKTSGQNVSETGKTSSETSYTLKPKVNISVNRHYDDKGNIIGFDSTYSTVYSTAKGDTTGMKKMMDRYMSFLERDQSSLSGDRFPSAFYDSILNKRFYGSDFFFKPFNFENFLPEALRKSDSVSLYARTREDVLKVKEKDKNK